MAYPSLANITFKLSSCYCNEIILSMNKRSNEQSIFMTNTKIFLIMVKIIVVKIKFDYNRDKC